MNKTKSDAIYNLLKANLQEVVINGISIRFIPELSIPRVWKDINKLVDEQEDIVWKELNKNSKLITVDGKGNLKRKKK